MKETFNGDGAVVYKYPLDFDDGVARLTIPGRVIHVGPDPSGLVCVWAVVWPTRNDVDVPVDIAVVGTGQSLPMGDWGHINTAIDGSYVWHFFAGSAGPSFPELSKEES